jgi:hypothetical protein
VLQITWNSIGITSRRRIPTSTEYVAQEYYFNTVAQNTSYPFVLRSRDGQHYLPTLKRYGADKLISLFTKQLATLNKLYSPPGSAAFDFFTLGFRLLVLFFLGFV